MQCFEFLEKIDNGSLHRSHALAYDGSIQDCIDKEYIYGDKEIVKGEIFYSNLRLTKSGLNLLRFTRLTIDDIDNSSGKDSLKTWLLRPIITGVSTALIVGLISFIAGVYFSDTLRKLLLPQENIQQQTKDQKNKQIPKPVNEKSKHQ